MFVDVMCWLWAKSHSMLKNVSCTWDCQGAQTSRTSAVKPLEGNGVWGGYCFWSSSSEDRRCLVWWGIAATADGC